MALGAGGQQGPPTPTGTADSITLVYKTLQILPTGSTLIQMQPGPNRQPPARSVLQQATKQCICWATGPTLPPH